MQPGLRQSGDAIKDVGEPGLGVEVVELRGVDEGVHHRRPVAAVIGAGEQLGFTSECNTAKRTLARVVCQADVAVIKEAGVPTYRHTKAAGCLR